MNPQELCWNMTATPIPISESDALFLRLDDAGGLGVDAEQTVGKAVTGFQRKFADRHAAGRMNVGYTHGLHRPAGA